MRYQQITPPDPTLSIITPDDAMAHANVTDETQAGYFQSLINLATERIEHELQRQYLSATWLCCLDAFPNEICLERTPVQAVTQIEYTDTEGNSQVLPSAQYQVDAICGNYPARIQPAYGLVWPVTRGYSRTWPTIEANHLGELPEITGFYNAVQVTFTAGYGTPDQVPEKVKHAIRLLVATWYRDREDTTLAVASIPIPEGVTRLLALEDWGGYA